MRISVRILDIECTYPRRNEMFVEQRQRKGKLLRVRQGCQQNNACEVQKRQNFQTRIITKTNCRYVS